MSAPRGETTTELKSGDTRPEPGTPKPAVGIDPNAPGIVHVAGQGVGYFPH